MMEGEYSTEHALTHLDFAGVDVGDIVSTIVSIIDTYKAPVGGG